MKISLFFLFITLTYTIQADFQNLESSFEDMQGFKCGDLTGIPTPIRLNVQGKVECLTDGKACLWNILTLNDCKAAISKAAANITVYACGSTVDTDENQWCEAGYRFFFDRWHCANETGQKLGLRIDATSGNCNCLSLNNQDCITDDSVCTTAQTHSVNGKVIVPLVCGRNYINKFGGRNPSLLPTAHWCKSCIAYFQGTGQWICGGDLGLGLNVPYRVNADGDIECFSLDGVNCAWNLGTGATCKNYIAANIARVRPLICGQYHTKYWPTDGYSLASHWCQRFQIYENRFKQNWQ